MTDKQKDLFRYLGGIPRSFLINLKVFGLQKAIKFPIIFSKNVIFKDLSGEIEVVNPRPFGIRIGFGHLDNSSYTKEKTVFLNKGKIIFNGSCRIGYGSAIINYGKLEFGNKFSISGKGTIICSKSIEIGEESLMSWDTLIMDCDQHPIYSGEKIVNENKKIVVGRKNWIGAKSTILKGVILGNNNVVALGSIVTKSYEGNNTIIGGNPSKVLKENIEWK